MKNIFGVASLFLLLCNCTAKHENSSSNLIVVPLHDITYNKSLKLSSFAESVEAIPLETTDESLIGEVRQLVYQDGKFFLRVSSGYLHSKVMIFSETGKFLRKIDREGQGKGEYIDMRDFVVTPQSQIKVLGYRKTVTYDTLGNDLCEISYPYSAEEGISLADGTYLISQTNVNHTNGKPLALLAENDELLSFFFQRDLVEIHAISSYRGINSFSRCGDQLYYGYPFCDTLFAVSGTQVTPKYLLDFGKHRVDYSDVAVEDGCLEIERKVGRKPYIRHDGFQVRPNYLILLLRNEKDEISLCFHSFQTHQTMNGVKIVDDMYLKGCMFPLTFKNAPFKVIDGYMYSIMYPVMLLNAYEQFRANLSAADWRQFAAANPRLVSLFEGLSEEDNPVLLRIKLKE